ncbi:MAG TPA: bi-domain-containing oxidoreductase [bacterium]|nr:bi-domain-containing oxidoreductase [bacterium]HPN42125.1 bi-domain-containing oxidoreductase [bacterium]
MIQAIIKKGQVISETIPAPMVSPNSVLIKVVNSCISAGTEVSGMMAARQSFIQKTLMQPEKIQKAVNKIKSDGFNYVYRQVRGMAVQEKQKAETGAPTGYSIAGIVLAVGEAVTKFKPGDHVAAAGAGFANHAEYVDVPENLVIPMPVDMSFVDASTVTLGGIAMQGVRRADLKLGEFCVVIGAGILGLLAIQILRISGIRVIALDFSNNRLSVAQSFGVENTINPANENPVKAVENITGGYGTDAVLFTAATSDNNALSQAFKMCKKKGKVILVGVAGNEVKRDDMYQKELDFLISTSYGPGRYDKNYEEKGLDYPYAYIRWTENRNMQEYLRLVNSRQIVLDKMINAIYPIEKVTDAFAALSAPDNKPLMVILDYGKIEQELINYKNHTRKISINSEPVNKDVINVALIGAGGFASTFHLPNIEKLNKKFRLQAVMDQSGLKAKNIAEKFNAGYATTNIEEILSDSDVDLVMICTRHDSHAPLTLQALHAGKHVFVEKPLATNQNELDGIVTYYQSLQNTLIKPNLMVGFNRRFSKYALEIKKHVDKRINPLFIHYRMNAGYLPLDHWVHENGGRMVGEMCHIIDLMSFLTNSVVESINCESLYPVNNKFSDKDNKSITLKYKDGSICSIDYFAVGSTKFPKEYMEVHFDEKTIIMDDYKSLQSFGFQINNITSRTSEKGHFEELEALYQILKTGNMITFIDFQDMVRTTEITFLIS